MFGMMCLAGSTPDSVNVLLRNAPPVAALNLFFNATGVVSSANGLGVLAAANFDVTVDTSVNSVTAVALGGNLLAQNPTFVEVLEIFFVGDELCVDEDQSVGNGANNIILPVIFIGLTCAGGTPAVASPPLAVSPPPPPPPPAPPAIVRFELGMLKNCTTIITGIHSPSIP